MQASTTVRSWPAIGLGLFFAGVTARVLLDDVVAGAPFTVVHLGSIAALVAALGAGHYAWPALRQGALVSGFILAVVFASSTGYVVVTSGMRNAERAGDKAASAGEINRQRDQVLKMRAEAEWMLAPCPAGTSRSLDGTKCGLRAAMAAECGSGKGKLCEGKSYSVRIYEAAIEGYDAKLAKLGPARAPSAGYAHAARVLAALSCAFGCPPSEQSSASPRPASGAADLIQANLELLMPFASVVIGELGTLGFLNLGLGHARTVRRQVPQAATTAGQSGDGGQFADLRKSSNPDRPARPSPKSKPSGALQDSPAFTREKAEADLVTLLALGQSVPSQRTLAQRWNRPKQTVSDWLKAWEADGIIPARRQVGRRKMMAA